MSCTKRVTTTHRDLVTERPEPLVLMQAVEQVWEEHELDCVLLVEDFGNYGELGLRGEVYQGASVQFVICLNRTLWRNNRMVVNAAKVTLRCQSSQILAAGHACTMVIHHSETTVDPFLLLVDTEHILRRQRIPTDIKAHRPVRLYMAGIYRCNVYVHGPN